MIRMGRGKDAGDVPETNQPTTYNYESQQISSKAISESDSMARDIKEGRLSGFVGHGTTLTGETEFQAMLRVDGHLIGTVSSGSGTLIVGTNGQVDANVTVAAAMINGTVNGDIIATEKLQLGRTARVMGNIQSPRLIVEEGAILEGSCAMLRARETQEEQSSASATAAASQYETAAVTEAAGTEELPEYIDDETDLFAEDEESAEAASV